MLRRPVEAAHVLGKLLARARARTHRVGHRLDWYGSPQPLIDAFRAFAIPERMQEEFGYPPLTAEIKARILGRQRARGLRHHRRRRRACRRRPRSRLGGVATPGHRRGGRRGGSGLTGLRRAGRRSAPGR